MFYFSVVSTLTIEDAENPMFLLCLEHREQCPTKAFADVLCCLWKLVVLVGLHPVILAVEWDCFAVGLAGGHVRLAGVRQGGGGIQHYNIGH